MEGASVAADQESETLIINVNLWRRQVTQSFLTNAVAETEILKVVSAVNTLVLFFAPAVLIFGLCTLTGCELVLIFGSSCANVWPKQFGQLTQLCLVSGN